MSASTWSPFQSSEVREICRHLTRAEADRVADRVAVYGVWAFLSVGIPIRIFTGSDALCTWIPAGTLAAAHVAIIPLWHRGTRRLLLSTEWA